MASDGIEQQQLDDFATLVTLAASGDAMAQQTLCSRYEREVLIATRVHLGPLLRPYIDSMDIAQSVHKSLLAGLRNEKLAIHSPQNLIALACTIARRKIARKWRTHRRQTRLDGTLSADALSNLLSSLRYSNDPAHDEQLATERIEHLCAEMSDLERVMVTMRLAGFTTNEVAERTGVNPIAIRVRWSRLRDRLNKVGGLQDFL
jgi:RNA polymerase sigma-70 factor (ECF subfamily)